LVEEKLVNQHGIIPIMWAWLNQPTKNLSGVRVTGAEHSRRFLRELDEAPGGSNLHYIYYSVLASLHKVTRV